jgi:hypothetical protein
MKWAKLSALQCRTLLVSIVTRCKNTWRREVRVGRCFLIARWNNSAHAR